MPNHFFGIDAFSVDHRRNLPVRTAGIEADAAAVQMTTNGLRTFIGSRAAFQREIQDLQLPLINLFKEITIKSPCSFFAVGLLQSGGDIAAATDADPETTDGPKKEFYISLHIPIVRIEHLLGAVDKGIPHGSVAFVPLNGDGDGLFCTLAVGICPQTEGDKFRIQCRNILHFVVYA